MTEIRSTAGALPHPDDDAEREARHQLLATLLGAYADGEVPSETASQIDAHLLGCARCRRELDMHRALRTRLEGESIPAASTALRDRILLALADAPVPPPASTAPQPKRWPLSTRATIAVVATAALAVALGGVLIAPALRNRQEPPITVVSLPSLLLFNEVLENYRRVTADDLPGRARDLATVRAALPFPVNAIDSPALRLLAAWTTNLDGEPAAVLAYRWKDRLVMQYVVSEQLLFRPSEVRRVFAEGRHLAARSGSQSLIAWPSESGGELLVADISIDELATLRGVRANR